MPTAGGPQLVDQNVAWAATMGAAWAANSRESPHDSPKAGAGAVGGGGSGRGRGWDQDDSDDKSSSEKPTSSNKRPTSATNRLPRAQGGQHRRNRCSQALCSRSPSSILDNLHFQGEDQIKAT